MATRAAGGSRVKRSSGRGRRRAASSRGGIRWDRVARISLLLVLAAVLVSYAGPTVEYLKARQLTNETRTEVNKLRHDKARLSRRARSLKDPQTIELEARKIGMARPGERVYVIRKLPKNSR
ncbi:hypothetical protein LCGC14_3122840 [marine sediment metagenome]|uniref:Septum formation initiator family protein n=1 Tax=marine sediment metagenome TaxID=412755 RepID=A0A0F8YRK4_9ZZZZ